MSSAILFAAIVAIWATVLMPRWLRSRPALPESTENDLTETGESGMPDSADVVLSDEQPVHAADADRGATREPVAPDVTARPAASAPSGAPRARLHRTAPARPALTSHGRVMRARRRMLATLALLTVAATGLAVANLVAMWIVIPPAATLLGFLVLLREAARTDAERASLRASYAMAGADSEVTAAPQPAYAPPAAPVEPEEVTAPEPAAASAQVTATYDSGPIAEIIDLAARINDQLYDQYADAEHRAVGD